MPVLQPIHRSPKSGVQRTQARNLIATARPDASQYKMVEDATICYSDYADMINPQAAVAHYRAGQSGLICKNIVVMPNQLFYLVRSTVAVSHYYVVALNQRTQTWQCSSTDERVANQCYGRVVQYRRWLQSQGRTEEVA